jgi:excisionase family DNA binding protein
MSAPKDRANDPNRKAEPRKLLTGAEVAARFSVHPKTVVRWHEQGKISGIKTLGGHNRFYEDDVEKLREPKSEKNE